MAMKVIRAGDVKYLTLLDLEPGMIVSEGVVVSTEVYRSRMTTVSGTFEVDDPERIAVYARIEPFMVEALQDSLAERAKSQ